MRRTLLIIAADIKVAHSVFALPFALLGACMAAAPAGPRSVDWPRFGGQLALIVLAMILARTAAMLANRLLDRRIDQGNPRTAGRALPSGRLRPETVRTVLLACAAAFMIVSAAFGVLYSNWWPLALGLPVLGWISAYPYLKRLTSLCHLYLGSALALSPPAAALAVDPAALRDQPAIWLLAATVLCWVAGFDIIYALQDLQADRRQKLKSIPSRLGPRRGLLVSRALHAGAAAGLVGAMLADARLALVFAVGTAAVVVLLVCEHATVARWGTRRIDVSFFTLNGVISCVVGLLGAIDVLTG